MLVYPLKSDLAKPGDSIPKLLSTALVRNRLPLMTRDIVAISSKVVAISEGRIRNLDMIRPSREARKLGAKYSLDPSFAQIVMDEADRTLGGVKGALLAIKDQDAVPNAGVDRKNAPPDSAVLWPRDPDATAETVRAWIRKTLKKSVGVVIVDSRVSPLRLGTTGFAIGLSGIQPVEDLRGRSDLSGRRIRITFRAVADGVAATAQLVMGEGSEQTPFAVIRGAPVRLNARSDMQRAKLPWNECLFMSHIMRSD